MFIALDRKIREKGADRKSEDKGWIVNFKVPSQLMK